MDKCLVWEENPQEAFVHVQTDCGSVASPHRQARGLLCQSSTSQEVLKTIAGEPAARISSGFMGLGLRVAKREGGDKRTESWEKRDFVSPQRKVERMGLLNNALGQWKELFFFKKK